MENAHDPRSLPDSEAASRTVGCFTRNLRRALVGMDIEEVAARSRIELQLLRGVLSGSVYPSVDVVAALEHVLDADLWPRRQ